MEGLPQGRLTALHTILKEMGSVLVAFSGGVDSTFLTRAAGDVFGPNTLAVTARSPSLPETELAEAIRLARTIGVRHLVLETHEVSDPRYAANPPDRCYFCKQELFGKLLPLAQKEGLRYVVYGAILDDLGDHRPGHRAAKDYSVRSPLQEAGLTKAEIRLLSREMGLPTWDKPAMACLASRIPYGQAVNPEKLRRIEAAEEVLRDRGFRQCRVRHHENLARIEVEPSLVPRLLNPTLMADVTRRLQDLGFASVTLDLRGYRSGSLNEALGHGT